ncbi:pyruvate/2-oxoglutarate dehydrogenase complex dihydrolipoamide acyltransferase (E2) component [Streptomyces glaucescens]
MTGTRVELRIRRLELDAPVGLSPAALCAAVEAELAVLLGLDGTSADARTDVPLAVRTAAPPAVQAAVPPTTPPTTPATASPAATPATTPPTLPTNPRAAALARHIARAVHDALRARDLEGDGAS